MLSKTKKKGQSTSMLVAVIIFWALIAVEAKIIGSAMLNQYVIDNPGKIPSVLTAAELFIKFSTFQVQGVHPALPAFLWVEAIIALILSFTIIVHGG